MTYNNIETRKVQQTGGSSFIVSLPKEWIEKHRIQPKDSIGILTQPDGTLLITPYASSQAFLKEKQIDVDEIKDSHFLFRLLIGAYIMGYNVIFVKSSKKFKPHVRKSVINFTRIAIGPEIEEESNNFIKIRDIVDAKEMPFEKTIKRMYILGLDMYEDSLIALKTGNKDLAEEVIKRDDEVDRLHWLIGRQANIVFSNIVLSQKMGVTLGQASQFHFISKFLERIADHAVSVAKNVLKIKDQKINSEIMEKISEVSKFSMQLLDNSMDAWRNKDIEQANHTIERVSELILKCEEISLNPNDEDVEAFIGISSILESIRRISEYSGDICEIIINNLI
ncbi:MAG: PhoU domain-containing protein [Promethearchaeota archaeon]|jgi:phosphate uptake regulator